MGQYELIDFGLKILVVVGIFAINMGICTFLVYSERKIASFMQTRIGPNRAGPKGLLQTVADALKLMTKESFVPRQADGVTYNLAPLLTVMPAFLGFAIIPIGPSFTVTISGEVHTVDLAMVNLNVGVLWLFAMSAIGAYGTMLAGWSSGSKYPLLGSVRATAQVISYEAALSLSLLPVVVWAGTLNVNEIVSLQGQWQWYGFGLMLIPFVIYFISAMAETNRPPFDLVEAESEIVAGFHTEYSGVRFMVFFLGEYLNVITMSAVAATFFFGGWNGPFLSGDPAEFAGWQVALGVLWFYLKTCAFLFIFIWARVSLPRIRYDQLMSLGWKVLIEANLAYVLLIGVAVVMQEVGAIPSGFFR